MREIDRKRWRRSLIDHLEDLPRQVAALETSLEPFGDDFDRQAFEEAFTSDDPRRYNQVQTVERAFARVQGYEARLADDGVKFMELPRRPTVAGEVAVQPSLEALRDAGVMSAALCRRLIRSQRDRNLLEHDYVRTAADEVHAAVNRLRETAPEFARRFGAWIGPSLIPNP